MLRSVRFCLATWLFLAAFSSQQCRVTMGTPLMGLEKLDAKKCVSYSRTLLSKVTEALQLDDLFKGFNCTEQNMVVERTQTVSVCEPNTNQDVRCSGRQNTRFNQNDCLRNIKEDLEHYKATLLAYREADLRSTVGKAIQDLLENCAFSSQPRDSAILKVFSHNEDLPNPFDRRVRLCKVLKGFHVRSITINRVMSYIAAEEHKI